MSAFNSGADWGDLAGIAFHKEKTAARRLAARACISRRDALQQVLFAVALPKSISELIADRQQTLAHQVARRDHRRQQQAELRHRKQALCESQAARWRAWFDGSASPNPGLIGLGAVLNSPLGAITEMSRAGGNGDSNDAEYLALIAVLEEAVSQRVTALSVYGDSRIVIEDVIGLHVVKALGPFRCQALRLLEFIGDTTFHWIPRAKNSRADALARAGR